MNKTTVQITGMHCRSCELLIEGEFKKIKGVKRVEASFKKKEVIIYSKYYLSDNKIKAVIERTGYKVGIEKPKSWITGDPQTYKDLFTALLIFIVIYILARRLGIFNLSLGAKNNPSSLLVVLMVGLTAGFSTCMALVGGLILGISARHAEKHPEATPMQKFRPHLYFNLGRIASYFVLGGVIGLIGKAFQLSGSVLGILTIIIGIVMLVVGFQLTELFPRLSNISLTLPTGLTKILGIKKHHEKEYSHLNSIMVGALTFFLPCGFTQAMQLYAMSTGNFLSGALIMGAFALGTAPGLLGIGGLTSAIKGAFARRFFKFAGIVVVGLAIFNISNGLNLTGLSAKFSSSNAKSESKNKPTSDPNVVEENGKQIVRMTQKSNGYSPNSFTIKKGIPTQWIVNSTDPNSCAASLYSKELNVRSYLKYGENKFEFTPNEVGKINFSCSMGMYRGYFEVVENNSVISSSPTVSAAATPSATPLPADPNAQVIKATYTERGDIQPKRFTVKANQPVRFEVLSQDDGQGCMSSITIPDLIEEYDILEKGKTTVFDFTPTKSGSYLITCSMGSPRGTITVQ